MKKMNVKKFARTFLVLIAVFALACAFSSMAFAADGETAAAAPDNNMGIGMIAAAALLLIFPHGDNPDDRNFIDAWSWALFGGVFVGSWRKVNPILLIILSAGAGILIYYIF